jgi:endonuclease I
MKHFTPVFSLVLLAFLSAGFGLSVAAQQTIAYWNFNGPDFSGNWPQPIDATTGDASISYTFSQTASFSGTGINGLENETNGGSFCPQGGTDNENNGRWFELSLPILTVSEMTLSYATRKTNTGFSTHDIQFTVDGTNWVSYQINDISGYGNNWVASQVETVIFTGIEGMANNEDFAIRIVVDGASSNMGNTRFDNLLLQTSEGVMQTEARLQTFDIGGTDLLSLTNIEVEDVAADAGAVCQVEDFSLLSGITLGAVSNTATMEVFVNSVLLEPSAYTDHVWHADDEIVVTVTAEDSQSVRHYKVTLLQMSFAGGFSISGELYDFKEVVVGNTSDVQFFYLSAGELTEDLVLTVPDGFGVSEDCRQAYAGSLTIPQSEGSFNDKKVFVNFLPSEVKDYSGHLIIQNGQDEGGLPLSGSGISSNIPYGYYATATGQKKELMTQLHQIINSHDVIYYSQIWTVIGAADRQFNDKVWDMYSSLSCAEPPYEFEYSLDQDKGVDTNTEGLYYNREHSWPSSWWGGSNADTMYTDVHHIFPTDKVVNSQRGNFPFGEVEDVQWFSLNGSLLGTNCFGTAYTGTVFEPIDAYKGDFARAWFYFVTRYQHRLRGWSDDYMVNLVLNGTDWPAFKPWLLEMLLEWHHSDPVSQKEIIRNDAISLYQGNRNPYIDHPEFVDQVFAIQTSEDLYYLNDVKVYPNPFDQVIHLSGLPDAYSGIMVCDGMGSVLYNASGSVTDIDTSNWLPGVYFVIVYNKGRPSETIKLIK